jgi:hypothetical protein
MTYEHFCYWLQGFLCLKGPLSEKERDCIKDKLNSVLGRSMNINVPPIQKLPLTNVIDCENGTTVILDGDKTISSFGSVNPEGKVELRNGK